MKSECKTLQVMLLALALFGVSSPTEVAATVAGNNGKCAGDTLNDKLQTSGVGDYDWEYLWKVGTVRETTKQAINDLEVLGWIPVVATADITQLKNPTKPSEFKFMAIGGSIASGVREGGLYREAQLTAYPNLVARQMGVSFRQPLFSASEANGSGYKVLIDGGGPVYQYEVVANNLAFDPKSQNKTFTKSIGDYDNLAMPYFNVRYPWKTMEYYDRPVSKIDEESTDFVRYFKRIMPDEDYNASGLTYQGYLKRQAVPDFIIYDLGMDGHLKGAMIGGYVSQLPMIMEGERGKKVEFLYMREVAAKGGKGVIVTIPDVIDFPYFHMYNLSKIKSLSSTVKVDVEKNNGKIRPANNQDIFLPSPAVIELFKQKKDIVLKETEVLAIDDELDETQKFRSVNWYNDYYVKYAAKENNFAVLDLYELYKRIHRGEYTTDDGIRADASFPNGNFYSSDGIHPSAFGQAIIANECIKAINKHYKTEIKVLPTAGFLKK